VSEDGFLSRWSRRKRAIEAGRPVAEPDAEPPPAAAPPAPPPEEPPFDITTLPAIDSLTAASDFTAFLRKEVPAALRHAALRRAWSLDPAIRDFVGPADYAWDYNAPDGVPGASLDLVGDLRERLAQVFGPEPAALGGAPGGVVSRVGNVAPEAGRGEDSPEGARGEDPPEHPPNAASPVGDAPDDTRMHASPGDAPRLSAPHDAPMLPPSFLAEAPRPVAGLPAPDAAPAALPPRRHGSALPS
jgi:hypothetical protein